MVIDINELRKRRKLGRDFYKGIDLLFALYQSMHYFYIDAHIKHVFINTTSTLGFVYPKTLQEAKQSFQDIKRLSPAYAPNDVIKYDLTYWTDVLVGQFISTREVVDKNSVIIGFFNIITRDYKRYLIKDEKKIIEIFDIPESSPSKLRLRIDKEKLEPKIFEFIELTNLPVKDKYIKTMLNIFSEGYTTIKKLRRG